MPSIQTSDARGLFTKKLIDIYRERISPMSFLRSFFKIKEASTLELSIEVQRGTEKIAVDIERGTDGNRNKFDKSTEKIFIPPFYREFFDATQLALYDRLFSDTSIEDGVFADFLNQVSEKLGMLQDKIERSYELQCAQVLETGIVQLNAGINIDFKRKAASLVDKGAGAYWVAGTVSPYDDLEAGALFLRQTGKSRGATINVIFGSTAFADFLDNTIVKERADIRNFSMDLLNAPQRNSVGASFHGQVSAGAFKFNLWTYPEFYDTAAGVSTPFINAKKIEMVPENPRFSLGFAAVPQLLTDGRKVEKGAFVMGDFIDQRKSTHDFEIKSAGVAIPVAVDQIYTLQVVA